MHPEAPAGNFGHTRDERRGGARYLYIYIYMYLFLFIYSFINWFHGHITEKPDVMTLSVRKVALGFEQIRKVAHEPQRLWMTVAKRWATTLERFTAKTLSVYKVT